jgi:penicillin-binding protein 2
LPQKGARGKIIDCQGNVLADNKLSYDLMILPQELDQVDKSLMSISGILGLNFNNLKDAFRNGFISTSMPATIVKNIEIKKAIALEQLKTEIPGLIIESNPVRHYPYASLASHIIGYVNEIDHWRLTKLADYGYKTKDIVGFGGVEEKYDYYLRQEEGGLSVEVNHRGRIVRSLGFSPPHNGRDLQLTMNLNLQKIAEEKLLNSKGCVIIMDPYSGGILAMASSPKFSPQAFVDKQSLSIRSLINDSDSALINRAISAAYPAGSIFKIIVATAALETKKINLSTSFLCHGKMLIGNQEFACWSTHNAQNLISAIAHSCNVFFYNTGLLIGAQTIHDYAVKFGFSRQTSFELPYETSGFIPSPLWRKINKFKNWYSGDTANLSIGQGDCLVTPLQLLRMMAVFANRGNLVTPYIVKSVDGRDISANTKKITSLSLKPGTIDYIRKGLRGVVSDPAGTGNVLSSLPINVAGKTGTAQAPPGQPHAWFVGFFPFENPKYAICVFLERGGPGYYSCVLAKQIIEAMIAQGLI